MSAISQQDEHWMRIALEQARKAWSQDEVPVGAVVVSGDELLSAAYNRPICDQDPTAHAEIVALRQASQNRQNYRLPGTTLYVTIEPCTMCVGAMIHARIDRLVFGALEPRAGAVVSRHRLLDDTSYNHQVQYVAGALEEECAELMSQFFKSKRDRAR